MRVTDPAFDRLTPAGKAAAEALASDAVSRIAALGLPLDVFSRAMGRVQRIIRDVAREAAAPAEPSPDADPSRPFSHVRREQHGPAEPDAPAWVHTWRHRETGAEIVATFPPFDWERLDGMVVLRHLRDADHARKLYPTATVTERPRSEAA